MSNVDPILLRELEEARKNPSYQRAIQPSKWNNYNSGTPLEQLEGELLRQQQEGIQETEIESIGFTNKPQKLDEADPVLLEGLKKFSPQSKTEDADPILIEGLNKLKPQQKQETPKEVDPILAEGLEKTKPGTINKIRKTWYETLEGAELAEKTSPAAYYGGGVAGLPLGILEFAATGIEKIFARFPEIMSINKKATSDPENKQKYEQELLTLLEKPSYANKLSEYMRKEFPQFMAGYDLINLVPATIGMSVIEGAGEGTEAVTSDATSGRKAKLLAEYLLYGLGGLGVTKTAKGKSPTKADFDPPRIPKDKVPVFEQMDLPFYDDMLPTQTPAKRYIPGHQFELDLTGGKMNERGVKEWVQQELDLKPSEPTQLKLELDSLDTSTPPIGLNRVNVTYGLKKAATLLDRGLVDKAKEVINSLWESKKAANENVAYEKMVTDRVRGPSRAKELFHRWERQGFLTREQAEIGRWIVDKNPALFKDLAMTMRSAKEQGKPVAGTYDAIDRLVTLIKDANSKDPTTVAHEILHHTERMQPPKIQEGIRAAWAKALVDFESWAISVDSLVARRAIAEVLRLNAGDATAQKNLREMFRSGELPNEFYKLITPSEFWAENGSRILSGRHAASREGWVAQARQWLSEFIEKTKDVFGLNSDAAVIRGLNEVMGGRGEYKTSQMLWMDSENKGLTGSRRGVYASLDPTVRETRTIRELVNTLPKPKLENDISKVGSSSMTASFRTKIHLQKPENRANPVWEVMSAVEDWVETFKERGKKRSVDAKRDIFSVSKNPHDLKQVLRVADDIERNRHEWHFPGGLMWPDDTFLKSKGLSDKQVGVYRALAKIQDKMYEMLEKVFEASNIKLPPRIPGHLSHFWLGPYKIKLRDSHGTAFVFAFPSKNEALRILPEIQKQATANGLSVEPSPTKNFVFEPKFKEHSMASILEGLSTVAENLQARQGQNARTWDKIIEVIESRQRMGIVTEMLDRNRRPMRGHEIDVFLNNPWVKKITAADMANNLAARFDGVNRFLEKVEVISEVWQPILESGFFKETPYAMEVLNKKINHFVGMEKNGLKGIETSFNLIFNKLGIDPNFLDAFGSKVAGMASVFYLWKAPFALATWFQTARLPSRAMMLEAYSLEVGKGYPKGLISGAYAEATKHHGHILEGIKGVLQGTFKSANTDWLKDPVIKKAVEIGAIDPVQLDLLAPQTNIFSGQIMLPFRVMDSAARLHTYIIGYYIGKRLHGDNIQAHYTAKRLTKETNVDYDRAFDAPHAFEEYGAIGRHGSQFWTYWAHELGSYTEMVNAIKSFSNPKAKKKAAEALLTKLVTDGAIAGIIGLPFIGLYDSISYLANQHFDADWPDSRTLALKLGAKAGGLFEDLIAARIGLSQDQTTKIKEGLENIPAFGLSPYAASALSIGDAGLPNVSGTMSGIGLPPGIVLADFMALWGNLSYMTIRELGALSDVERRPTPSEWRKLVNELPTHLRTPGEYALKNKNIRDAYEQLFGESSIPDYSTDKSNDPIYLRSAADRQSLIQWQTKSVNESKETIRFNNLLRDFKKIDLKNTHAMKLLVEDSRFKVLSPQQKQILLKRLAERGSGEPDSLINGISNEIVKGKTSGMDRLKQDIKSKAHADKYKQRSTEY